jgi:glycosyltransferase involved in cell wall biosynthesis
MLPAVSIIIPYYNHGRHLHQTVTSALRGYRGPLDIIVVNDGSREPKAPIYLQNVQALSDSVRVLAQANQGLSAARNAGLNVARGEYIQFLDSDDMLVPGKIDLQIAHLAVQPRVDVSLSDYLLCEDTASIFRAESSSIAPFDFSLKDFLLNWERGFSVPIHCALFRARALAGFRFDTDVAGKEDWIFWSRLANAGRRFSYVPTYGALYRQHPESLSKDFERMGESWNAAVDAIESVVGAKVPEFRAASNRWYDSFYRPRIALQTNLRLPLRDTPSIEPESQTADLSWISEIAKKRNTDMRAPLISVVVPVYNHYTHLRQCLSSIARQTIRGAYEIVVVNDASTDPRVSEVLRAFAAAVPAVKLIEAPMNMGISKAQNAAVEAAAGTYVAFVDCDDYLPQGALTEVEKHLADAPDYIFTDRFDVDQTGRTLRIAEYGGYEQIRPTGNIAGDLAQGMVASHLKVIRRQSYLDIGGSDPNFDGVQDWELALRVAAVQGRFLYIPHPLYCHRIHANSVTTSDSVRQFWLTNVARRKYMALTHSKNWDSREALGLGRAASFAVANGETIASSVAVFTGFEDRSRFDDVQKARASGKTCIYSVKPQPPLHELNLLREFNSLFDAILTADEVAVLSLMGYVWDRKALVFAGEALLVGSTNPEASNLVALAG